MEWPSRLSLRFRAMVAVVAVVLVPLAWVWSATVAGEEQTLVGVRGQLRDARAEIVAGTDPSDVARAWELRVRVVDDAGAITLDEDRIDVLPWWHALSDPLYGPAGPPDPRAYDTELGPVGERAEVRGARERGLDEDCNVSLTRGLVLCAAAARLPDGRVVHVEGAAARLMLSLYEDRFQLTGLLVLSGVVGVMVALWIGNGIVRPIQQLRRQVADRIARGSLAPVDQAHTAEIGELASSFNQLMATIEARNRANEAFAADLAHELKNPVAAVRAAAEALGRGAPDPARTERLARVLDDSGRRMDLVISRFLDLARAEAGLVADSRERFDLSVLAGRLVEGFARDPRYDVTKFEFTGEPCPVDASPERLETAIRNLLSNAAAFSGGRVEVAVAGGKLSVRDHGPGIPADDLPKVFERYWSGREGGTGLGLPLAKAIAEAHGGTLEAASRPGEGATFTLTLPVA